MKQKFAKWCDDFKMAMMGLVLATKRPKFWIAFFIVFTIFGTLMSLLSGGMNAINLFFATDFGGKMAILRDGFLSLFGISKAFGDWILLFSITVLQAILISLIVLVWKKRARKYNTSDSSNIQGASIAAGLALLGSGCPTCGTALITPIVSSIFSSSSIAIAGTVSGIITAIAFVILILSIKKVGLETYVIIIDEKWRSRQKNERENSKK